MVVAALAQLGQELASRWLRRRPLARAISRSFSWRAWGSGLAVGALAGALRKLDAYAKRIPMEVAPAVAPLAQVNPLQAHGGGMLALFSTHPSTEQRVARLQVADLERGVD